MPIEFNVNPYNDDFNADNGPRENNYMRILFKPGYAVQARELTQLQTAIQNQIKLFGDHIFQDGSQVLGGHLTLDNSVISLKLESKFANTDIELSDFNNQLISNSVGVQNKKAKVLAVDDGGEYKTLMIRYIRGVEFEDGDLIKTLPGNKQARLIAAGAANVGSIVSINEGVFYVNGFFVSVPEQTIVLDSYSRTPTYRIGLEIEETIVDDSADATLLDPAQESFNYQAPGADRYQFNLVLSKRTLDSLDDSSFFELLRVENGVVTKQVKYALYSEIEKTLARRTYDESGNYTVYPFRASTSDIEGNDGAFNVNIEPGKAYVKGFEFETVGTTSIPVAKARQTELVTDYDLSLEFGNYITVSNFYSGVFGIFDTTQFEQVDFHVVPTANINSTNFTTYGKTLAGTARVKSLQRNSGEKFDLFLLEQEMSNLTFTIVSATETTVTFPSDLPNNPAGVYNGVSFTITSGPGAGQTRKIVSYNTSRVATIDREFDDVPTSSSQITLNYAIKDVESIVVRPIEYNVIRYGGQDPAQAAYPSMDVDSRSKSSEGETFISRTNYNKLLFSLPESAISRNDFSNIDFIHRKLYIDQTFSSGSFTITLSGKEKFYYGSDGSFLSDSSAEDNFIVIVRDPGSSSYNAGQVLDMSSDGSNGITRLSQTQVRLDAGTQTFSADLFVNVKIENASDSPAIVKQKILRGNKTAITQVNFGNATESVTGQSNTFVDLANSTVWFTDTSEIVKTPGVKQSLYISDVINVNKIFDSGNPRYLPNSTNAIDITSHYLFDSGQRDNYYDHGAIILKDGKAPPSGQCAVLLTHFEHSGEDGFFTKESYSQSDIDNNYVTTYSSPIVGTTSLADAIDFRPRRADLSVGFGIGGLKIPFTEFPMEMSYGYYIPRIDKIVVTADKNFKVINGIAAKYPKVPADVQDTMTIYTMFIPPYTKKATDVKFKFHDNRRYTMRDIGRIEKRVERLEYYTQLSLLEQQARDEVYLYEDRILEKEKYGILVDQFDGFNIADNKNPDLLCHIAFNQLKPYKKVSSIDMQLMSSTGTYKLNDRTYSLSYTEEEVISQNAATKAISVQPYLFGTFSGEIELRPELDNWVSEIFQPDIVIPDPIVNERPTVPPPPPEPVFVFVEPPPWDPPRWPPVVPDPPIVVPQPQPVVVAPVIPETVQPVTHVGFDTTVFTPPPPVETTIVQTLVDQVVAPPQISLPNFPIFPIGDFVGGGIPQWSLFTSDLMTSTAPAEVPEPPRFNGQSGGGGRNNRQFVGSGAGRRRN
jgi:hypothetical protein